LGGGADSNTLPRRCPLPWFTIEFCRMAHHLPVTAQREQPAPLPAAPAIDTSKSVDERCCKPRTSCRSGPIPPYPTAGSPWRRQYSGLPGACQAACRQNDL